MAQVRGNDDLASICSSLSSDDGVHVNGGVGRTGEHLIDLLTRPRSRGGYGGRLNYSQFSTLAQSLGWSSEDMDDCWYDIMMGEPSAEAKDMSRVAECVCSYCLASPLPLLENYKLASEEVTSARSSATSSSSAPVKHKVKQTEGKVGRLATTPPQLAKLPAHNRSNSTTVDLSPPSPRPQTVTASATAAPSPPSQPPLPASPETETKKRADTANTDAQATLRKPSGMSPRYAVATLSSERKKHTAAPSSSPSPAAQQHRRPSPRQQSTSPSRRADTASPQRFAKTVFFRLYENGMEQQRQRRTAKPFTTAQGEEETAQCTFQPKIRPYKLKTTEGEERRARYKKPTQSYFAKLMEDGGDRSNSSDAIAKAPPTPRVTYHPAPGPSTNVPTGYVEGVARLRRYVASRYEHAAFKNSLRDPVRPDVHRLVEAPILRLPVMVEGVADTVDVRLAPARRLSPPREQAQLPMPRVVYVEGAETPTTRVSTPRRSSPGMIRYKEHPSYY